MPRHRAIEFRRRAGACWAGDGRGQLSRLHDWQGLDGREVTSELHLPRRHLFRRAWLRGLAVVLVVAFTLPLALGVAALFLAPVYVIGLIVPALGARFDVLLEVATLCIAWPALLGAMLPNLLRDIAKI